MQPDSGQRMRIRTLFVHGAAQASERRCGGGMRAVVGVSDRLIFRHFQTETLLPDMSFAAVARDPDIGPWCGAI